MRDQIGHGDSHPRIDMKKVVNKIFELKRLRVLGFTFLSNVVVELPELLVIAIDQTRVVRILFIGQIEGRMSHY